jgi:preprotein translocase subunit SecY
MNGVQGKFEELRKRVLFTLFMLGVYRVATQVPMPGVNADALASFFSSNSNNLLGVFNTFSGGALQRFSVLALGIMPYITSSIIFSLLTVSFPQLAELQKEAGGHKKIQQYTRYATVLLCFIQGYGLAVGLENMQSPNSAMPIVISPGWDFRLLTIISLTAGTMFVMWLRRANY